MKPLALSLAIASVIAISGGASAAIETEKTTMTKPAVSPAAASNPFFTASTLALHFPQFDKIKDSDFAPAFDRGMADNTAEINAIANNAAAPTFENTILAMEKSGQLLTRAAIVFGNLTGANTNDKVSIMSNGVGCRISGYTNTA